MPREAYGWQILPDATRDAHITLVEKRFYEGLVPIAEKIRSAES